MKIEKNISVILIDPEKQTITVETIEHSLKGFYATLDCTTIEAAYPDLPGQHFLYCDEEGSFKRQRFYFWMPGLRQPLCGKSCILRLLPGSDGETASCTLDIDADELRSEILFLGTGKPTIN